MSPSLTLNRIRWNPSGDRPCEDGWTTLLRYVGKTRADDEPVSLLTVLDSNGLDDALWCLRAIEGHDRAIRLFACDCAARVLPIFERARPSDDRPHRAIETARRFANGNASDAELSDAQAGARDAQAAARDGAFKPSVEAAYAANHTCNDKAAITIAAVPAAAAAGGDSERAWQKQRFRALVAEIEGDDAA